MSELTGPDSVCHVDGCDEPAVRTPRATIADDVPDSGIDADPGQLVPLCAVHAEQADAPEGGSAADGVVDPTAPGDAAPGDVG